MNTKDSQTIQEVNLKTPEMGSVMVETATSVFNAGTIDENMMSPEDKDKINKLTEEINLTNTDQVMKYGVAAQKGISHISIFK